jgi:hypothetical protein
MSSIYLWLEDRKGKASYIFWTNLMQELCPDVIVESKTNNSELVKAVKSLNDEENKYIIVFDNSFDNQQIYQESRILGKYASKKDNVKLLNLICFEYILLEFDSLLDWIYAPEDEFRTKRKIAINAREKLIEAIRSEEQNYKLMKEIVMYDNNLLEHNIEQLSAKLLFDLTRNIGFKVTKGSIGNCWINNCCEWTKRQEDDICGLDYERLSKSEKMHSIYNGTSLKYSFPLAGLEVQNG